MKDFHIAVPTSFHPDEKLNSETTVQHIIYLYHQGVRSVMICGSTGEQHSLSLEEKLELLEYIENYDLPDDLEIIFGVSSTRQVFTVELAMAVARSARVSAILLGFPPYIMPSQTDVLHYCYAVMQAAGNKSIILYNNPRRTGFDVSVDTMLKLLENPQIIGVKEAGEMNKVEKVLHQVQREVLIFYGGESELELAVTKGYNALSSIAGNLYPNEISQYFYQLKNQIEISSDTKLAIEELYRQPLLPYIKHKISQKEKIAFGTCRLPLGSQF